MFRHLNPRFMLKCIILEKKNHFNYLRVVEYLYTNETFFKNIDYISNSKLMLDTEILENVYYVYHWPFGMLYMVVNFFKYLV